MIRINDNRASSPVGFSEFTSYENFYEGQVKYAVIVECPEGEDVNLYTVISARCNSARQVEVTQISGEGINRWIHGSTGWFVQEVDANIIVTISDKDPLPF